MAAFYITGGVLAGWALVVTALGIMSKDFPGSANGERAVIGISVVLVAAAIGASIVTAGSEEEEGGSEAHATEVAEEAGGGEAEEAAPAEAAPPAEESSPAPEAEGGATLEISADEGGQLAYDVDSLEAEAGTVEIVMGNPSSVPHNVAIDGNGVDEKGEVVTEGGTSTATADLEPGEYSFYCSVPGHRQAGMEGTLTVE